MDESIREIIREYRKKGRLEEIYNSLVNGLLQIKNEERLDQDNPAKDLIKEIVIKSPSKKVEILMEIRYIIENSKRNQGKLILPEQLEDLILKILQELLNGQDLKVLNTFSGTGSLVVTLAIGFDCSEIISHERDSEEVELQKKVFDLCNLEVDVVKTNTLSVDSPTDKFDLVVGCPPFNVRLKDNEVKLDTHDPDKIETMEQAFIVKSIESVKADGIIVGILSPNILFGTRNQEIRNIIMEETNLLAIIEGPGNTFSYSGVSPVIVILKKKSTVNNDPENVLMASFSETNISSDQFKEEKEELIEEWRQYLREEDLNAS